MASESHQRVVDCLENLGVEYEVMDCDPDLADTEVFCERYDIPLDCSANTLIVKSKSGEVRFVACVLLAMTRLDVNKTVRKKMGVRRISFASADETRDLTGMIIGGVTPLPLPADLELWVDARVMDAPYVILGGGDRATKLKVSPKLFLATPNTQIVEGLAYAKEAD
jgi:prolyl-tRNA editing enzyme YbaK/EbsC (Cys-tRNA(Pro) deacylase)